MGLSSRQQAIERVHGDQNLASNGHSRKVTIDEPKAPASPIANLLPGQEVVERVHEEFILFRMTPTYASMHSDSRECTSGFPGKSGEASVNSNAFGDNVGTARTGTLPSAEHPTLLHRRRSQAYASP